jgi:streptogramin lyase
MMQSARPVVLIVAVLASFGFANGQSLTGQVRSPEGPLEGVLVSAQRVNTPVTVTVVSDVTGKYSFPRNRLDPGRYTLHIRATGYDLEDSGPVEITAGKTASADLTLAKTKDLSAQLSNAEWLLSMPGPDDQKSFLLNCVNCHRLDFITRSRHTSAEFIQVMERMSTYANQSTPLKPQRRKAERLLEDRGESRRLARERQAAYMSTVNLKAGSAQPASWNYDLKTLPRPTGKGTQVIITEYDLPRKTIQPHDVIVDSAGIVWYSNFGEQEIGRFDPRTAKLTEFSIPVTKPGWPVGELGLRADRQGNLWFGVSFQATVAKFDPKTERFQTFPLTGEFNRDMTQVNMASPQSSHVDGKIWLQNNGFAMIHRLDPATGKFEDFAPFKGSKEGENHNIYDVIPDSHNNVYFTDFYAEHIGRIDAKTGQIRLFPTPTRASAPRRAQMDSEDRLWIGEYRGNRIAMFDTKTEHFTEWEAPTPFSAPYDVALDKQGYAWTGSMSSDRVLRLDPRSGQFTEYLMPRFTNIRRVFVDNSGPKPVLWIGNNHGASILKVEPLDE